MKTAIRTAQLIVGLVVAGLPLDDALAQMSKREFIKRAETSGTFMDIFPAFTTNRCATAAVVSPNAYVQRLRNPESPLRLGDQLLAIDGQPLIQASEGAVPRALSTIAPDAEIVLTVLRSGQRIDVRTQCSDSLPMYAPLSEIYRAISGKRFDACLDRIPEAESAWGGMTSSIHWLQSHCRLYAKRLSRSEWPLVQYEQYRLLIDEARWDPTEYEAARSEILRSEGYFRQQGQAGLFEELKRQLEASRPVGAGS
jgi:hypothetical protein